MLFFSLFALTAFAQGKVTPAPPLTDARQHHTATLLSDGRVLVLGGRGSDALSTLGSCELFDPKKNRWSKCAPLGVPRSHHAATLLQDGRVLVTGSRLGGAFIGCRLPLDEHLSLPSPRLDSQDEAALPR